MVALSFNAAGVKPNVALEAVPSGIYPVVITATTEKPTKSGNGSYIEFEMQVQGGEFQGRKLFDRLNIRNPSQTAVDIAYATLSAICHVTNRLQMQDTAQLHGIPFQVVVAKLPRDDRPDQMTNEVKGYKDINGNDPGMSGQVSQTTAQPAWAAGGQQGQVQTQQAPVQQQIQQQPQYVQQGQVQQGQVVQGQVVQQQPVQQQPVQQVQQQPVQQVQQQAPAVVDGNAPPPWVTGGQTAAA